MKDSKFINISILHLEIIYFIKFYLNSYIKSKNAKIRINGKLDIDNNRINIVKLLKYKFPLFYNKYSDETIKKCVQEIISNAYNNNRINTSIYKISIKKIDQFIKENNIRINEILY